MIDGVLLNPTRSALLDVLTAMGCRVSVLSVEEQHGELVGTISLVPGASKPVEISGAQTALLIDELPVLAATAPFGAGLVVRDAGELRVKESDRLSAVTRNLRRWVRRWSRPLMAGAFPAARSCTVPRSRASAITASPWRLRSQHKRAEGETLIHNSACVAISYPSFFADLEKLLER